MSALASTGLASIGNSWIPTPEWGLDGRCGCTSLRSRKRQGIDTSTLQQQHLVAGEHGDPDPAIADGDPHQLMLPAEGLDK